MHNLGSLVRKTTLLSSHKPFFILEIKANGYSLHAKDSTKIVNHSKVLFYLASTTTKSNYEKTIIII